MGMFDYVKYSTLCPYCSDTTLTDFQSKSGPCNLSYLEPKDVRDFYTVCPRCGKWVEYDVDIVEYEVNLKEHPALEIS